MKLIPRIIFLLSFIILAGMNSYLAGENYQEGELITLYVGEVKSFAVDNPTRVAINNPQVADVSSISRNEMVIAAKGTGTTNLIWWDSLGEHAYQLQVFAENMSAVKQRIDGLIAALNLPEVSTRRADSEGKVLLLGKVKTPQDLERIDTALGALKAKTTNLISVEEEAASVEIEVQVLELNKDETKKLGFTPPVGTSLTEPAGKYGSKLTDIPEALFHLAKWTRQTLNAQLDLLVQEGKARVLSRPRLVCQSGMEAELLVGGEKPIMSTTVSEGTTATEVEYKEYGIKLKIRPRIIPENRIQVSLNVDVSEVGEAEVLGTTEKTLTSETTITTAKAYPLIKRNTSTQLILDNGQTLAMSGLIKQKSEEELRKFPWLADVPVLGMFFRGKTVTSGGGRGELGDTELVITLTPSILAKAGVFQEMVRRQTAKGEEITKEFEVGSPAITNYTRKVIKRIQDNFIYPSEAYQKKIEGVVHLSLHLSSTGELLEVKIRQSSGWSILDENATKIIKRVSPFPAFPADIKEKELWINIPIAYNIK